MDISKEPLGDGRSTEQPLFHCVLPSELIDLFGEEGKEVTIVFSFPDVFVPLALIA